MYALIAGGKSRYCAAGAEKNLGSWGEIFAENV